MIPDSLKKQLLEKHGIPIVRMVAESGGDINRAYRIQSKDRDYFLKFNQSAPNDFFEKEAAGLQELKNAGTQLHIPEVIASGRPDANTPGFLLMEYVNSGRSGDSFLLGTELARLHSTKRELYGLSIDNYIGSLPQKNDQKSDWISFFTENRIAPQLEMAFNSGKLSPAILRNWKRLVKELPSIFPLSKPSLIHGDLWSGNYLFDENGSAVLIDPAVYYGHPEMDLAFTRMFGGFSEDFYRGYKSVSPLEPGFSERVPIYNLYPLLVHVNLFGGHYTSQLEQILHQF